MIEDTLPVDKIIQGDTLQVLKTFPDDCIDCIITSPPYWGLRDYGIEGQIGLEPTLDGYIEKLLKITVELKRVLKPTGVMFWNHGDNYSSQPTGSSKALTNPFGKKYVHSGKNADEILKIHGRQKKILPVPQKCLCLQNYRAIILMIDKQGWILRNVIIWHKPNHMPSSVRDRFTNSYEPVFMLVKKKKYWFDLDAVRVPHSESIKERCKYPVNAFGSFDETGARLGKRIQKGGNPKEIKLNPLGKNPSDFWDDELLNKLVSTRITKRDEKGRIIAVGRKYGLDEQYFENIDTPEKAYWFGFLFADGNVNKDRNRIIVGLSQKDEYHLELLKQDLQSEQPLEYEILNGSPCVFLRMNSKKMAEDLVKHGIKTQKAFESIPEYLLNHFIRGLFDGDGWVRYRIASNGVSIDFEVGFVNKDIEIVKKVQKIFKKISGSKSERIREYKGGFDFAIGGRRQVEKIGYWLYNNATRYLIRKKSIFPQFINDNPDVWIIPTQPFPDAHFAVFPPSLVDPMIKAGCPEWICKRCGKPRARIVGIEKTHNRENKRPDANVRPDNLERPPPDWKPKDIKFIGWSDCGCNAGWKPGIVLDPFAGSGTTLYTARKLNRHYIGIELNPEYIKMAKKRLSKFGARLEEYDNGGDKIC